MQFRAPTYRATVATILATTTLWSAAEARQRNTPQPWAEATYATPAEILAQQEQHARAQRAQGHQYAPQTLPTHPATALAPTARYIPPRWANSPQQVYSPASAPQHVPSYRTSPVGVFRPGSPNDPSLRLTSAQRERRDPYREVALRAAEEAARRLAHFSAQAETNEAPHRTPIRNLQLASLDPMHPNRAAQLRDDSSSLEANCTDCYTNTRTRPAGGYQNPIYGIQVPMGAIANTGIENANIVMAAIQQEAQACRKFADFKRMSGTGCDRFGLENNPYLTKGMCSQAVRAAANRAGVPMPGANSGKQSSFLNSRASGLIKIPFNTNTAPGGTFIVCQGGGSGYGHIEIVVDLASGDRIYCSDFCTGKSSCRPGNNLGFRNAEMFKFPGT